MTTKDKIKSVIDSMTTLIKPGFLAGSLQALNIEKIDFYPTALFIQPISGKYVVDTQIKKQSNVFIWFAVVNSERLHGTGEQVNVDEENMHLFVQNFIKTYNQSAHFEKLKEVNWEFTTDRLDANLSGIILTFTAKEIVGYSVC